MRLNELLRTIENYITVLRLIKKLEIWVLNELKDMQLTQWMEFATFRWISDVYNQQQEDNQMYICLSSL